MLRRALYMLGFSLLCAAPFALLADTMQSTGYKIQSDSINFGGGLSTSTNYKTEDTLGEIATGNSSSTNYLLKAGYQQMTGSYISITDASDTSLPNVGGISGGSSSGSLGWTVTTDNAAGYSLSIAAATSPALKSPLASFADYTPGGADPDYSFSIVSTASAFGFSPEGTDILAKYKDNGSACNTGSSDTADKCWDGFSTVEKMISQRASGNHPSGTLTTVKLRAEVGADHIQENGAYTTTLSVTAVTL